MHGLRQSENRGTAWSALMQKENQAVTDYWLEHYVADPPLALCSLCGNTGIIDTTETAISPVGARPGRKNWCICPNGQALRSGVFEVVHSVEKSVQEVENLKAHVNTE